MLDDDMLISPSFLPVKSNVCPKLLLINEPVFLIELDRIIIFPPFFWLNPHVPICCGQNQRVPPSELRGMVTGKIQCTLVQTSDGSSGQKQRDFIGHISTELGLKEAKYGTSTTKHGDFVR